MIELPMNPEPVKIRNTMWIGVRVTICPDVILEDNLILASGAVVTKSFPSICIIGGVPARTIRKITD